MPKKKLQKQITKKLETLQKLLDNIDEARSIEPDDPETWDSDTLYNLVAELKEILKLLEDKIVKGKYDGCGDPVILEVGLCSLVDEFHEEEEAIEEE